MTALIFMGCFSLNALAQDHKRNWDNGNVVAVTEVHIKDGMFNAYINDLNNVWRVYLEEQMKDGSIVGYNKMCPAAKRKRGTSDTAHNAVGFARAVLILVDQRKRRMVVVPNCKPESREGRRHDLPRKQALLPSLECEQPNRD